MNFIPEGYVLKIYALPNKNVTVPFTLNYLLRFKNILGSFQNFSYSFLREFANNYIIQVSQVIIY